MKRFFRGKDTVVIQKEDENDVDENYVDEASTAAVTASDVRTPSATIIRMNQIIQSRHVNKDNILDGGQLLKWVDTCACLSAERMAGYPCVTVSVDDLYFSRDVKLGQVLNLISQVNRVFRTSMEVSVKVSYEDLSEKKEYSVCEAFMTFVALDANNKRVTLPPFQCATEEEKLNYSLANDRRRVRLNYNLTLKTLISEYNPSPQRSRSPINGVYPQSDLAFPSIDTVDSSDTMTESVELVLPPHANHHGNTFGGQVMAWMENIASISAGRLCRGVAILRSVDMVYFRGPSTVGDRIVFKAMVNNSFQTSLEVGVRVEAYSCDEGRIGPRRHINSAFFTFDIKANSNSDALPVLTCNSMDGQRRQKEATARRKMRLDRRYILTRRSQEALSVSWNNINALILCYSNIKVLTRLAAKNDWKIASTSDTMELSTREEEGVLSFCATMKLQRPYKASDIFEILRNPMKRPDWDPVTVSCTLIKKVESDDAIYKSVMQPTVEGDPQNDFVLLISNRAPSSANEFYRIAIRSVTLDIAPPVEEYSRTEVACAGFVIRQKEGVCTEISYYNETNPKLVSYVTCDIAGLNDLYCKVFTSLGEYLKLHLTEVNKIASSSREDARAQISKGFKF